MAFEQAMEGEYLFGVDRGNKLPFETYNSATAELRGIIRACVREGKSLRAHGSLWSLSTVAVTDGRLIDNTPLRLAFEVPPDLTDPLYGGDAARLLFPECDNSVAALNDCLFSRGLSIKGCAHSRARTQPLR